jgi:aminopeptidase N
MIRSGAIGALSQFKSSEEALELILKYTEPGVPQALRLAAIRALGTISTGQSKPNVERILDRLDTIASESFFLTQVSAVLALGAMEAPEPWAFCNPWRITPPMGGSVVGPRRRCKRCRKPLAKTRRWKSCKQEIDELKQSNQELKSRLENLEAKAKV